MRAATAIAVDGHPPVKPALTTTTATPDAAVVSFARMNDGFCNSQQHATRHYRLNRK